MRRMTLSAVHPGSFAYRSGLARSPAATGGRDRLRAGNRHHGEDISNDNAAIDVFDPRRGIDDDPVRQRRLGKHLDVVGGHEVAAVQRGPGARGVVEGQRAARARRPGRRRRACGSPRPG